MERKIDEQKYPLIKSLAAHILYLFVITLYLNLDYCTTHRKISKLRYVVILWLIKRLPLQMCIMACHFLLIPCSEKSKWIVKVVIMILIQPPGMYTFIWKLLFVLVLIQCLFFGRRHFSSRYCLTILLPCQLPFLWKNTPPFVVDLLVPFISFNAYSSLQFWFPSFLLLKQPHLHHRWHHNQLYCFFTLSVISWYFLSFIQSESFCSLLYNVLNNLISYYFCTAEMEKSEHRENCLLLEKVPCFFSSISYHMSIKIPGWSLIKLEIKLISTILIAYFILAKFNVA